MNVHDSLNHSQSCQHKQDDDGSKESNNYNTVKGADYASL